VGFLPELLSSFDWSDLISLLPAIIILTWKRVDKRLKKYQVLRAQMNMVRAHVNVQIVNVKKNFAKDLKHFLNKHRNKDDCSGVDYGRILLLHESVVDSAFYGGTEEMRKIFDENGLPDADDAFFERYCNEKFDLFESRIWGYYAEHYCKEVFILEYEDRESKYNAARSAHLKTFELVIKKGRAIYLKGGSIT